MFFPIWIALKLIAAIKKVFDIFLVKIIFRLKCFSQPDNLYLLEISDI